MSDRQILSRPLLFAFGVALLCASVAQGQVIDTLDFFTADDPNIELETASGTSPLSETAIGNAIVRVKFRTAQFHEYYKYDQNWIYLFYDSSWGVQPSGASSYELNFNGGKGGRWMKRWMTVGESVTESSSSGLRTFNPDCTVNSTGSWQYTNTLESYNPAYNIGGDLGTIEVIVLAYDWINGVERFFYSRTYGWVRWESWSAGSTTLLTATSWNHFTGRTKVLPQAKCKAFPSACSPPNASCSGTWSCSGQVCFAQPPPAGECASPFNWCYAGCCCRCV